MMKEKMVVKTEKDLIYKAGKNWRIATLFLLVGFLCVGIQRLCEIVFHLPVANLLLSTAFFIGQLVLVCLFILSTLLLTHSQLSVYGITGAQLLSMRLSHKELKISTQILVTLSWLILGTIFLYLNWEIASITMFVFLLIFIGYHLHHTVRLCYDKGYMLERIQKLVDLSFLGQSKLEENYMVELLFKEILKNAKDNQQQYLSSDLQFLFYIYQNTQQIAIQKQIETKLEAITSCLLLSQPLQLISNEILKKLENTNNAMYTKLALQIAKNLLLHFKTDDQNELTEKNILQTLYTLFRPITDKTYLENLATTLLQTEQYIMDNKKLSSDQKNDWIYQFYATLTAFKYLPETLKSLNFTCLISIILQKVSNNSTQNIDLLLSAMQDNENDSKNMTTYLIASIHVLLYAYDKKYHIPTIKDMLVTLPTTQKSSWPDLENHLQSSRGVYIKYYDKIMQQVDILSQQLQEPTFYTYANEFFLYYWFLQEDSDYSILFQKQAYACPTLSNMIDVVDYTEQQNYDNVVAFQHFYSIDTAFDTVKAEKIVDYIRNEYIAFVFDRQKNLQQAVLTKGIDQICNRINNHILNHLNEIPFSKPNLNINDQNTFTLKFLVTNQDLQSEYLEDLLDLVNRTYQQTILKEMIDATTTKLELKNFYYRPQRENLSYVSSWIDSFNCDCRTKLLTQNIDVLDNPMETDFKNFENKEKLLIDVSKITYHRYIYFNSDKVNIFNCPLSTTIRELSQAELQKVIEEHKKGEYYQIENFLSDYEDATTYYPLAYKMIEVQYSMETIIEDRAGFEILFGYPDDQFNEDTFQEVTPKEQDSLQNQTSLDTYLSTTTLPPSN